MAALAGQFIDDLHRLERADRGADGGCTQGQVRLHLRHAQQDAARELFEHQADIAGARAKRGDDPLSPLNPE